LSRYIGVGTYDTQNMLIGKLLNNFEYDPDIIKQQDAILAPISNTIREPDIASASMSMYVASQLTEPVRERHINRFASVREHWYKRYHKTTGYIPQKMIGVDFNYQKHYNHGIELRIFDYFPEEYLKDVINILLLVCQFSMNLPIPDPHEFECYDDQLIESIKDGATGDICDEYVLQLAKIFECEEMYEMHMNIRPDHEHNTMTHHTITHHTSLHDIFQKLSDVLYVSLKDAPFMKRISPEMPRPRITDYNTFMYNLNKNFIVRGDYHDHGIDTDTYTECKPVPNSIPIHTKKKRIGSKCVIS
jgi:hypothetical protein